MEGVQANPLNPLSGVATAALEILVLIACAQKPTFDPHADLSSRVRGLNFGLSLHLYPYFMYVSSKVSGESEP